MRAREFVKESKGKIPKRLKVAAKGTMLMRDPGGYDRVYHLNRIWMAAAKADGKSTNPVDMDDSSFVEKFNFANPYTEEEHMMLHAAMNTVPTEGHELTQWSRSEELPSVYKTSPVANWMKKHD
jgi:hypothetical protein